MGGFIINILKKCPGSKIRSKGKGKGLGVGKGRGPINRSGRNRRSGRGK